MRFHRMWVFVVLVMLLSTVLVAQDEENKKDKDVLTTTSYSGLKLRNIGPAFTSGRIADFAVNPNDINEYYVAVASGNIWKTINSGTTWEPVFDNYGAYSIGCVTIDPNNTNVVWAGTGENNHQRALGYGDGVYKSVDGGESWKNMGLKESRQIGDIVIDPRNSDIVFVAAEGSVWGPGGDRGLYKTLDGGKTWKKVLEISENTGVNNVVIDPSNPNIMYATSEQRRRHVFTKIGGGPESAVYKSVDGGDSWYKIMKGLPKVDIGGMGIDVSPVDPNIVYLIVEAAYNKGGFYRSTNKGESWKRMSDHSASGQYYNEIYCDPINVDKVYSVETISHFTEDGGKTWKPVGNKHRHVDDHALWINPNNTKHFLIGSDGGVYESFDGGKNFSFKENLPVTQFYRVAVDYDEPFYNVYGGTQDNSSMGGPSRTLRSNGILNEDWFVTNGGDGFWSAIDPVDPNIVYAESQYGNMVRYDKQSGEAIDIRPEPRKGELSYKWNWNTPLIISPHKHTRLYCAANKVFKSDDRGDTWEVISEDISAQIDRNSFPVMGKYWSIDAVVKDVSTSLFGMAVSLSESPVKENLLFVGTDDGLIQVTEDLKSWKKIEEFPGVPKHTYVSDILTSKFDENVVIASFDNRKRDDFKPYILISKDKGESWESISSNLPKNGTVHTIEQDFVNPNLLFVGTEFGLFFSPNMGEKWIQLKSGIPTIAVRDIVIQKRESDLVCATFGRGFYILDDYSPLRKISREYLNSTEADIFPIKDALMYIPIRAKYGQGETFYAAKNPEFGAEITYFLKEVPKTKKELRKEKEKKLFEKGEKIPQPTYAQIREEEREESPHLIFTFSDADGNPVRRITKPASKGISRLAWDLRYQSQFPINAKNNKFNPTKKSEGAGLIMPGKYFVSMSLFHNGVTKSLVEKVPFNAVTLNNRTLPVKDREDLVTFQRKVSDLNRVIRGTYSYARQMAERIENIKQAIYAAPMADTSLINEARELSVKVDNILFKFTGQKPRASAEEVPPSEVPLNNRLSVIIWSHWRSTSSVTKTQRDAYNILLEEFPPVYNEIKQIGESAIPKLEEAMEKIKAPYTKGRLPNFELN